MADLETYRRMLAVNKHRLDDELEIQPDIMMRIASEVTLANSRMLDAKDQLEREEAQLWQEARESRAEVKLSNEDIKAGIVRHRQRVRAFERYQEARATWEQWNAMLEAWRQRGFSMNRLSDLYVAQYFSNDATTFTRDRERRNAENDEGRAALRRASHEPLATRSLRSLIQDSSEHKPPPAEAAPARRRVIDG